METTSKRDCWALRERRNLYLRAFVPRFKSHFRVTAGRGSGYGGGYFFEMQFYDRPLWRAEDDKGYAAARFCW
jgi:hypothetical protein